MIDPNFLREFMQKIWDHSESEDGPNEAITLREYSRKLKRLRLKVNPPQ